MHKYSRRLAARLGFTLLFVVLTVGCSTLDLRETEPGVAAQKVGYWIKMPKKESGSMIFGVRIPW
ncbi:MAG: hypothetical protein DRR03_05595 [Gammaproteobacteria bacterium]|nr:MAG: hypothetical protein DRR03_05595 [Gammaproteobacteria bacterium]